MGYDPAGSASNATQLQGRQISGASPSNGDELTWDAGLSVWKPEPESGGGGTVLTGNLVWVDAVNGNDSTGTRGHEELPFLTLGAAKTAASSGDTVVVLPGTYNENNLAKNGVNWHFFVGANVTYTGSNGAGIFDDSSAGANSSVVFNVSGYGKFTFSTSAVGGPGGVLYITNASSNVSVTCQSMLNTVQGNACTNILNGTVNVTADLLNATSGYNVWWFNGDVYIRAHRISNSRNAAIFSDCSTTPTGKLWVDCDTVVNTSSGGSSAIQFTDTNTSATVWINAREVLKSGNGSAISRVGGFAGRFYLLCQKLSTTSSTSPVIGNDGVTGDAGNIWISTEKITSNGGVFLDTGVSPTTNYWLQAQNWESLSTVTTGLNITGGTVTIQGSGGLLTATTGASVSGGTAWLNNLNYVCTTDISQSGGTANVQGGSGSGTNGRFVTSGTVNTPTPYLVSANNLSDLASISTARTNLGANTVGANLFTATNPSAISFPKIAADNSVSFRTPSQVLSDIGAGTGNGSVTSIATTSPISGGTITGTGTISLLTNVDFALAAAQTVTLSTSGVVYPLIASTSDSGVTTRQSIAIRQNNNSASHQLELGIASSNFSGTLLGQSLVTGASTPYINSGTNSIVVAVGGTSVCQIIGGANPGIHIGTGSTGPQAASSLTLDGTRIDGMSGSGLTVNAYNGALVLGSNNTTALTLDTSQGITFTKSLKSTTALATPSALSATQWTGFASTVSGAAIMGYGTTNDVSLMNRAGTVVLGVGPNTTVVNIPGSLTLGTALAVAQGGIGATSLASAGIAASGANSDLTSLALTLASTNKITDSGTNTTVYPWTISHDSSGTPAASLGVGLKFQLASTTTADQNAASIEALWTTATHASRASVITFNTVTGAGSLTEQARVMGNGFNVTGPNGIFTLGGDYNFEGYNTAAASQTRDTTKRDFVFFRGGTYTGDAVHVVAWASVSSGGGDVNSNKDTNLSRISAGLLGVGTGAQGSFAGRQKLTTQIYAGTTIASLPASPTTGEVASVTDGDSGLAWGATAVNSGGSATKYLVWYNGSAWTVVGK